MAEAEQAYRSAIRLSYENGLAHDALGRVEEKEMDTALGKPGRKQYLAEAAEQFSIAIAQNGSTRISWIVLQMDRRELPKPSSTLLLPMSLMIAVTC